MSAPAALLPALKMQHRGCRRAEDRSAPLRPSAATPSTCWCMRTRWCASSQKYRWIAALVGCGVLTGVGAALRSAGLEAGQTVAVFGCGGVGLSIVQGARIGGARRIIAVDMFESKRDMATRAGATDFVNSGEDDPVKAVRALTGGLGVDHAFEAVGNAKLCRQAIESLAIRGTATIVGVLPPDATIEFPWMAIRPECKVQTSRMGSNRFRIDIPLYLDFYRQGRLDLDAMVTKRGKLGDINDAFRAMKAGEVARTVLTFD